MNADVSRRARHDLTGLTVLLGGARSGKSTTAEAWGRMHAAGGGSVAVVATGEPFDVEMADRIDHHRALRPTDWITIEEPVDLAGAITSAPADAYVVVDCLTTWLANLVVRDLVADADERATAALDAIDRRRGPTVVISNEVGWGIVPADAMSRDYRDRLGRINQSFVARSTDAYLLVAGRALRLDPLDVPPFG